MVRVSVALIIRVHFPGREPGSVDVDDVVRLSNITLNGQNIDQIDNFEVFSDTLERLSLRNNKIARVENLEFLTALKELDLSNNEIADLSSVDIGTSLQINSM